MCVSKYQRGVQMRFLTAFMMTLFSLPTGAVDLAQNFNFDGVLTDNSNNPMTGPVNLLFQIYNPSESCLIFEETHASVALLDGAFSVKVGTGARAVAGVDGGAPLKQIFQNSSQIRSAGANCASPYIPAAGDGRRLRITVNGTPLTPSYSLSPVPMATVAETLQGRTPTDFLSATTTNSQTILGPLSLTDVLGIGPGANQVILQAPSLGAPVFLTLPANTGAAGQVLTTDGTGIMSWTSPAGGGGGTVSTVTAAAPLTVTNGTTTPNIELSDSGVTAGSYGSSLLIPNITVDGKGRITNVSEMPLVALSSFNGLNSPTQTLGTPGTTGSAPNWASGAGTHTLNIPMASSIGVSAGLISKTEYDTFTNKIDMGMTGNGPNMIPMLNSGAQLQLQSGTNSMPTYSFSSSPDTGVYSPATGEMSFSVNGMDAMSLTPTGVGIGTGFPNASLHIQESSGDAILNVEAFSTGNAVKSVFIRGANSASVGFDPSQTDLKVKTMNSIPITLATNNTERVRITPIGDLGVGTPAPQAKLHVSGGSILGGYYDNNTTPNLDWSLGNVQSATNCSTYTLNNMRDGGVYRLVVTNSNTGTCSFTDAGGRTIRHRGGSLNFTSGVNPVVFIFTVVPGHVIVTPESTNGA